jgi:hypothetical protein
MHGLFKVNMKWNARIKKNNYSLSLKSMGKTISPFLIILIMTHNIEFVSRATSLFVTWNVIWILVTTTFSPIYTHTHTHTQTCEMTGFQSWWIINVHTPWVIQCFSHLFLWKFAERSKRHLMSCLFYNLTE